MILCVTLNPCLDKTLIVPAWRPGDLVRGRQVHQVVGGKGNNVARALKRLGHSARPVTFLGGPAGLLCEHLLRHEDGFDPLIAPTQSATRTILTVRTDQGPDQTAFFDPDPEISLAEADDLQKRVEKELTGGDVTALALSGSSPSPTTHGLFSDLICMARSRRVPIFLDTYGAALEAIWGFWPEVIHLNRREAGLNLGRQRPTDEDLAGLLARWADHGVRCALITDGPETVLGRYDDLTFRVEPPDVDVVNPIGSGDSLLAGLIDAWLNGMGPEESVRRGLACALANAKAWDAGAIDVETVRTLEGEVVVEATPAENSSRVGKSLRMGRTRKR